jgi:hypothetical protein
MIIGNKFNGYSRDNIRLYPMDGGGSSTPSSTTTTAELPEWARNYAKDTLGKASALTDVNQNPYQAYGADRIAGFSPMQQQAQAGAAGMQTSGATGFGTQLAGAAGLNALGAQYDPTQFRANQFNDRSAQQYMSPYMQNVVDIQQREAQRQGDIAGTQRGAQAVGAGAFGGSRQAIMDAEAARNLSQQKGDIQAKGLQSSYEQAQAQFNADQARRMQAQQLTEQSKQYGAGYGMQGLQTALQGAGQLGALGQQQFGQGMDINKLQSAYGGQQQALEQQGLTQAYQDFQNQQNYPYKQLGFMSDMIRGLPLGQQSTSQMYEAPGSVTGQIAGLGTGMLGLSKFMADGGSVNSYADGGSVDSQQNVANIVGQLSNEQLKQALQAAQARADMDQIEAIQREMAERASMSKGLASIPMDYEAMMPDENVGMANGGIVAFANGGNSSLEGLPGEALSAPYAEDSGMSLRQLLAKPVTEGEAYTPSLRSALFGYDIQKPVAKTAAKTEEKPAAKAEAKAEVKKSAPAVKAAVKEATAPASISKAVSTIAEETGTPKQTLMEQYKEIEKSLSGNNQATTDILKKAEEKLAGRAEEIKGRGLGEALMAFGFDMAAKASKPGARFLESAAGASPTLGKAAMENQKLQEAAQDNLAKMQIDRAKYEQAMQKQDTAAATQLLAQVRQGEQHAAELAEKIAQNQRTNALQERQLGISAAHYGKGPAIMQIADDLQKSNPELSREDALNKASSLSNAGSLARTDVANLSAFNTALQKVREKLIGLNMPEGSPMRVAAEKELGVEKARLEKIHGISGGGGAAAPSFAGYSMVGEKPKP